MKIYIGSDHAGFELKEELKEYLDSLGYQVEDKGAFNFEKADDYPDFVFPVAHAVASDPERSRGLVMGKSGQGEAMAANRIKGVRAAVWYGPACAGAVSVGKCDPEEMLKLSRKHNDANILSLAAGFVSAEEAKKAVSFWLNAPFINEERHARRIKKLDQFL